MTVISPINYEYLEVVSMETSKVVKRLDVTGRSERARNKIEMGLMRNMNMEAYYISYNTYPLAQSLNPA